MQMSAVELLLSKSLGPVGPCVTVGLQFVRTHFVLRTWRECRGGAHRHPCSAPLVFICFDQFVNSPMNISAFAVAIPSLTTIH